MSELNFDKLNKLLDSGDYAQLRQSLKEMNEVDIADFLSKLDNENLLIVFRILHKDTSADVFAYLDTDDQAHIVKSITDRELNALVNNLFIDDTVDFLEEVPANVVTRVLAVADKETRDTINRFLKYPENSAGSIMTNEMVELHDYFNVSQAIDHIRRIGLDKETIYTCYCIDDRRKLVGTIGLNELIFNKPESLIRDIMDDREHLISVNTHDDQEQVAEIARKYDLLCVPVTDSEGRLVGIVTIDDIVDIIEEENTEDFERMALLQPSENEYLKTNVFTLAKNRILWLLILMVSATFTGKIIENFENKLALIAGLTAAIPMLMDTGGNAGNQVSTLIIRGLALGEIKLKDFFKVFFKELRVSIICGVILISANFVRMLLLGINDTSAQKYKVYMVICIAMFFAIVIAKLIGCSLPMLAKLVKLDPALMAGPMITTIVDAVTLVIYFWFASMILDFSAGANAVSAVGSTLSCAMTGLL